MSHQDDLDKQRELAIALKRYHALQLKECFDPFKPESRPTPKQLELMREQKHVLFQYLMGGNQSGKTQTGARITVWWFKREHPFIDIDKEWPNQPILIVIVGRLNNQVEEIWTKKIKPFLDVTEYRENRQGGTLQYVVNPKNGSKIIFATHHDPVNSREKLQSYTAHFVWLDELTEHLPIIEELQRRVQANRGRMLLTFTPKIRAESVKRFLETPTPYSKIYRISMLDNPLYDGRREEILSQIMGLPESQRNTILYGDWFVGEQAVFSYNPSLHNENPVGYNVLWPHIVAVDPAASGLMGYTLWAAPHQHAHTWYCVGSEYLKGSAPSDLVDLVQAKTAHVQQSIIFRVCDSHESWFMKQATKMKVFYRGIPNKHSRKKELIQGLNQGLSNGRIRLTDACPDLAAELGSAQWSETVEDRIVNASSYHLADCAQYLNDMLPLAKEIEQRTMTFDHALHLANKQRKANEAAAAKGQRKTFRIVSKGGRTLWNR